ncbi:MAG: hypothetical protein LBQ41_03580 [Candidatus Ancillula sp.]|nr:hypothetical protein [Candidatus Ancillula sp.]
MVKPSETWRIGVIIVSFGNEEDIAKLALQVNRQLKTGDKLLVVDNKPGANLRNYFLARGDKTSEINVVPHANGGFGAGANFGAKLIIDDIDLLLIVNPDMQVKQKNFISTIRAGAGKFDCFGPIIIDSETKLVQSASLPLHVSGLSYSGFFGTTADDPRLQDDFETTGINGGCFAIKKEWWEKTGGFNEKFFMYYEDRELSTRLKMLGAKLGILAGAQILHNYEYAKSDYKWEFLELNRLRAMLIAWPTKLLVVSFLVNIVLNFMIFVQYVSNKKGLLKLKADLRFLHDIPWCLRMRKALKAQVKVKSSDFLGLLDAQFNSTQEPFLQRPFVDKCFKVYYRILKAVC